MLNKLLEKQKTFTTHFFEALDLNPIKQLVELLVNCQGTVFFSGVGKSGLVAKKIAFTMVSTGTRAFYLCPTDSVHGDLGLVSNQDIFIILSKSGESDEFLNLIPAIHNKGALIVGVVCNPESRLAKSSQLVINLPFQSELCPFDMAPTMSTSFQALFGDLLTIAVMQQKNFSLDQYALNHPSGRIGKRMLLKVKDLMLKNEKIPLCKPHQKLGDVLVELSNKRCGCILVINDEQQLLGIFTDGDLRRLLQAKGGDILQMSIEDAMTVNPQWIGPDVLIWESIKQMEANVHKRISVLPVLDNHKKVIGLIHLHDAIQAGL